MCKSPVFLNVVRYTTSMEKAFKGGEKSGDKGRERSERPLSLVELQRQEAFAFVLAELDRRLPTSLKETFISNEREYKLTNAEDCMVAFAQQNREAVEALTEDLISQNNYRAEQAVVKLLKLFETYERMVILYAELRSYYPTAAVAVENKLPPLSSVRVHADTIWNNINE